MIWRRVPAESEEEAFDKVVSELERDAPQIAWRDRSVWEIKIALDGYGREEKE